MESKEKPSKVIAIIPARKGSKRLPGKNFKILNGKPLISWTIEETLKCEFIDEIIINTNDPEIIYIATQYHDSRIVIYERPEKYAQDLSTQEEIITNCMKGRDLQSKIILLQPTSPLRTAHDIQRAFQIFGEGDKTLISVYREDSLHFKINGAVYLFRLGEVSRGDIYDSNSFHIYVMPKDCSIDIDTIEDFKEAKRLKKDE